jgi:hypothetical protein
MVLLLDCERKEWWVRLLAAPQQCQHFTIPFTADLEIITARSNLGGIYGAV